jgi:hypothetical protein
MTLTEALAAAHAHRNAHAPTLYALADQAGETQDYYDYDRAKEEYDEVAVIHLDAILDAHQQEASA